MSLAVSRRRLLQIAAGAAAAWMAAPWIPSLADTASIAHDGATPLGTSSDPVTTTLEAFADTLIPGQKRFDGDYAIAGVVTGPGAVQAGVIDLMTFPAAGISEALPAYVAALTAEATAYIAEHRTLVDPTLPPLVALSYADRTALLLQLLDPTQEQFMVWYALAAFPFLAFHTAGQMPTASAVRQGHPGLAMIGFPHPDQDGLWRFPRFSYRRQLAASHPDTTSGGSPT